MSGQASKNVVIVLALIAAGFFAAWLRFRSYLGSEGRFSDGQRTYDIAGAGEVRYAVWDRPMRVEGDAAAGEGEARPALSPDGRWLVFSVGQRGLGVDLYLAEMVGGRATDARPLAILNSDADDCAPAFGGDCLYFASDRSGTIGGLDLYRAPFSSGVFGEPARLEGGLCTTADDTDPAPVPGSPALAFASNRAGAGLAQFDLFLARPAADAAPDWQVEALAALNTEFDEREPAFTGDGRHVFFASDRPGGAGGFDLYRSALGSAGWVPPVPLLGLNGAGAERGPLPAADGFELLLAIEDDPALAAGEAHLARARSLELFRVPGRPVGWRELLVLAALLALALLAWLAKRWEELEVLYKCLLVSLVVHGLLLWWFREVYPEPGRIDLDGPGERMRVRLGSDPDPSPAADVERAGRLTAERAPSPASEPIPLPPEAFAGSAALAEAAAAVRLERGASAPPADPARAVAALADPVPARSPATVALRASDETFERRAGAAAELALAAPERAARATPSPVQPAGTTRAARLAAGAGPLAPPASERVERAAPGALPEAPRLERPELAPPLGTSSERGAPVALAAADESFERRSGEAAELVLAAEGPPERRPAAEVGPERAPSGAAAASELAPAGAPAPQPLVADAPRPLEAPRPRPGAVLPPAQGPAGSVAAASVALEDDEVLAPRHPAAPAELALAAPGSWQEPLERAPAGPRRGGALAVEVDLAPTPFALPRALERVQEPTEPADPSARAEAALLERVEAPVRDVALRDAEGPLESVPSVPAPPVEVALETPRTFSTSARALGSLERRRLAIAPLEPSPAGGRRPGSALPAPSEEREHSAPPRPALAVLDPSPRELAPRELTLGSPEERRAQPAHPDAGVPRALAVEPLALFAGVVDRDRARELEPPRRRAAEPSPSAAPRPARRALGSAPAARPDHAPRVARWDHTPYQSRAGVLKLQALELHGGSDETEAAVASGLAYLARIQAADGYWGSPDDRHEKYRHVAIGKTGLSLLAFLGAGHTAGSESEHSRVVGRAVDFLIAVQDPATGHFGDCSSYGHGIATYALAECFALTGEERLRAPLEAAVARILSQQMHDRDPQRNGGWGYYYPDGATFDRWPRASITAWQVMALESARLGGLTVPDAAFEDARSFLRNCWDPGRGAFRYSHDPSRLSSSYDILPGSTPASLFALSLLGDDVASAPFAPARAFVEARAPRGYARARDDEFVADARGNLYFWYYGTLALFRVGGDPWRRWNAAMQETLLPAQEQDGSWRPISIYALDYAGDDDRDRSYTTAMCVLSLEIYYRYFTPLLKVE